MWSRLRFVGILAVAMSVAGSLHAQEPKKQDDFGFDKVKVLTFWDTDRGLSVAAAIAVGQPFAGNPLGAVGGRVLASRLIVLAEPWQFNFTKALPLDARYLERIKDRRPLPDVRLRELRELKGSDAAIYLALNQAIHRADQATLEMLEKSADENRHVTYADLNKNSGDWRGKVIPVKGKLVTIRKVHAPRLVEKEIKWIYYGYIEGPTRGAPPYAIVFTEMPLNLEVGEKQNAVVTMNGYYLGLIRFQADKESRKTQPDVISPYVIGKTLIVNDVQPVAKADDEAHSYYLVIGALGGFAVLGVCGAVALIWFRRGDQRIHSQLLQVREKNLPFTLESSETETAPAPPTVEHPNGAGGPQG